MIALFLALPGSTRSTMRLARDARHAAALVRAFALSRGVSHLAVDWSARAARKGA